jgi:glutaredoxin
VEDTALWKAGRICVLLLLLAAAPFARAGEDVHAYAFVSDGCPHCEKAWDFLSRQAQADARLRVHRLEVTKDPGNRRLMAAAAARLGVQPSGVPFVVIGSRAFVGYADEATTGSAYAAAIAACRAASCPDALAAARTAAAAGPTEARVPGRIAVPLLGEVSLRGLSLPALTIVLAAIDGFNPCAMWTLVFLIGLLLGMKDRARMWTLGIAFIAGSAAVYFLFMAAWLNLLLFLGTVAWVRVAIALVAIAGGLYYLREYVLNPEAACKVTAPEGRQRVLGKLRELAGERNFLLALCGILVLAFAVNLVEAVCSAGIPAVYAQVLAANALAAWQYYAFIGLYIAVFMLDDLVVFVAAMKTLELAGVGTRYTRGSNLAGGVLLLALGAVMLLRPHWLMFA